MNIKQAIAITKGSELFVELTDENGNVKEVKVHESQVKDLRIIAADSVLFGEHKNLYDKLTFRQALEQGITISPELIEVRKKPVWKHKSGKWPEYLGEELFAFIREAKPIREPYIKSETNCPTCGSRVLVAGDVTHYYVPIEQAKEETNEAELWASVIFDARWYDGTPQDLTKLTDHLKSKFTLKRK